MQDAEFCRSCRGMGVGECLQDADFGIALEGNKTLSYSGRNTNLEQGPF